MATSKTPKGPRLTPRLQDKTVVLFRARPDGNVWMGPQLNEDDETFDPDATETMVTLSDELKKELGNPEVITVLIIRGDKTETDPQVQLSEQLKRSAAKNERPRTKSPKI